MGLGEGYLRFARQHPGYFRLFRFPPPDRPEEGEALQPATRIAQRIGEETNRMADLLREAIAEGVVRSIDPVATARFLWAAWDGVIASHLGPANMSLTDTEFEEMLNRARETIVLGLLIPPRNEVVGLCLLVLLIVFTGGATHARRQPDPAAGAGRPTAPSLRARTSSSA